MAQPRSLFIWKDDFLKEDASNVPALAPDEINQLKFEPVIETNLLSDDSAILAGNSLTYNNVAILIPNLISRFSIQNGQASTGRTWTLAFNYVSGSPPTDTFTFQCSGDNRKVSQFAFFSTRDITSIVLDNTPNSIALRVVAAFGTAPVVKRESL